MNDRPDWSECAFEYRSSRERISALVGTADAALLARRVQACPDWSVKDLCAHLVGVPAALVTGDVPGGDTDGWVSSQVEARADRTIGELLDEWANVSPAFEQMMIDMRGRIAGLLLDVIAHEHDLRETLARPGARDSRGVVLAMGFTEFLMDRDLQQHHLPPVRVISPDGTWQAGGEDPPAVVLDYTDRADGTFELLRLLGSRRSRSQVAAAGWQGDWQAVEHGLFHMPLPVADYLE